MRKTEPFSKTCSASRLYSKAHIAIKYFSPYLVDYNRSKLINSWSISGAWSMVPSSIKPASRSTTRFDNEMPSFEQAVKSEITLKQMTNAIADSERSIEPKQVHTWCCLCPSRNQASQSVPQSYRRLLTYNAIEAWEAKQKSRGWRPPEREKETYINRWTSCLRGISAFSLAAVELRTDRHQHQEYKADGQNYKAVDGL